ncbi:hypothetical protein ACFL3Q_07690 [Planctomycetota bacterium]
MKTRTILFTLVIFCALGIWAPKLQGSITPYYEVQTVWFGDPPTSEFVFIQNTDGINSWAGESPGALEGVAINDNLNSAGVGTPAEGFYGSQGAVVVYNVPGVAGNGAFCALSSAFPSGDGGPGGSGLPTNLGEAVLYVDVAFEVPGRPEITTLSNVLNFWVAEADGSSFELEAEDSLDLTTNGWQTYMYTLSTLPLEPGSSGMFGDSDATLVSVEFEEPPSPIDLENIIYFVDNFRIESFGETLFFEDFEPQTATIADTLVFFDTSVADSTLVGNGPGKSSDGRMSALRNMIEVAGDLIENGLYEEACEQLWDAYRKCDGEPIPPDFVAGSATPTLASMILDLMAALGC